MKNSFTCEEEKISKFDRQTLYKFFTRWYNKGTIEVGNRLHGFGFKSLIIFPLIICTKSRIFFKVLLFVHIGTF